MPPKSLAAWLVIPASGKRPIADDEPAGSGSEKENEATTKRRRTATTKTSTTKTASKSTAGSKRTAASTTKPVAQTTGTAKKASAPSGLTEKSARKLSDDVVKAVEKKYNEMNRAIDKKGVRTPNTDAFAKAVAKYTSDVNKIAKVDTAIAFNLLMFLADASHADLDVHPKMCGYGESERVFAKLDDALAELIETREQPDERLSELPEVSHRWTRADAIDIWDYEVGWPNKQNRARIFTHRLAWEKERRAERRGRRQDCEDWVSVALQDLKEESDYLEKYGVNGYLPKSIALLENLRNA